MWCVCVCVCVCVRYNSLQMLIRPTPSLFRALTRYEIENKKNEYNTKGVRMMCVCVVDVLDACVCKIFEGCCVILL